jgi:ribosomal protein S18 acetylase RimI-like enzyme
MNWWLGKRSVDPVVRLAKPTDRPALAALLADTWRRHGIMAVEEQVALLANGSSLIALSGDEAVGFFGLSPRAPVGDPAELWIDITLAAVAADQPLTRVMSRLLKSAAAVLRQRSGTGLVCLTTQDWLIHALAENGFHEEDRVVSYVRPNHGPLPALPHVANLRAARPDQTETVLALNAAAFGPFWRYDQRTVLFWVMTADRVMLAEQGGRALGFALTTLNTTDGYAQLIRVATHPASRRQGIGRQLVADAIHYAADVGAAGVSLNTQDSNTASQRLYEALGFRPTSGALSVMVRRS